MNDWNASGKEDREHPGLEDRLKAYYGPVLKEQPLPPSSWQHLRLQLSLHHSRRLRYGRHWSVRWRRERRKVPVFIQSAFTRIMYEARLSYAPSMLSYTLRPHVRVPGVRVFLLGRHNIRLTLPSSETAQSLDPPELDVLLATGLARYVCMRKPTYALRRFLLSSVIPLTWIILALLWVVGFQHVLFPMAIGLCFAVCVIALWLLHKQGRSLARRADELIVLWLGRGRACHGLHSLADQSHTPSRRRWADLSLEERIAQVCGTQVRVEDQGLTLVR